MYDLVKTIATSAGPLFLEGYTQAKTISYKSAIDLVTDYDVKIELYLKEKLAAVFPEHMLVGEETSEGITHPDKAIYIDPIDGTTNFVLGHPGYAVSIAAEVDGTVVAGAVADPVHDDIYEAVLGGGARCNGRPIGVRPTERLDRAVVATGFSYLPYRRRDQAQVLTTALAEIADIRRMGSAASDLCSVAAGRVDAYYEIGLNEWDLAAGALIAAEAGATVRRRTITETDPQHRDAPPLLVPLIVASAPRIADALDELLRRSGLR